jgi:hypothetical protein
MMVYIHLIVVMEAQKETRAQEDPCIYELALVSAETQLLVSRRIARMSYCRRKGSGAVAVLDMAVNQGLVLGNSGTLSAT